MLEEAPPPVARDTTKRSALGVLPACTLLAVACCGLVASAVASPLGPPHPAMLPGNFARNIRNLECVSRKTQEKGTCMFALSCLKLNGTHLGVCVDRFYYGSCCRLPDLDQEVDIGGGDSNDISAGGLLKPVTAANVAEIDASPSTARPLTTLVTKVPAKVTTTTTVRPLKPVATAAPTKKPAATPPPFTAATPTKKPVVVTSAKPVTSATTKPQPKPTPAATTPVKKPPVAATTAKPAALVTNATTTAKPQKPTTVNKPVTKPPTVVTKPASPVTKPPAPVTKPPVAVTKPTPVTKPPTLATKPPVILTKPTQKPTAAATKPTQKPITTAKPTVKPTPVTSKPVTTSTSTVSNEVSSKPVTTATSRPIIEAVEEETNALSEGQKPSTARPTPPSFSGSSSSAKPSPPTFPSSVSTSRPTPPTFPNTSAKPVESSAKPVTTAKPLNSTDENWVQIQLSTTSPAPAKPTPTYPDGSLFTEEIPAGVSRPTPPTFAPVSQMTTTTESGELMAPPLNMSDYKQVCGRRLLPDGRIVGGTRSTFAKWPWQISLRQWRTSTYLHKCGAALLNENWAITAAHCVENVPPSDLLLRLGEHDLSTESEAHPHLERRVQIVASHPQFDSRTFEYDLALLRFYEPVVFQPNVIPICIPQDDKNYVGENAYVTGWGRLYEDGPLPSVMQEVSVPVLENAVCETMYRSAGYIEHIPNIFICAGWKKGGFDSCEGDSGGPMVIQRDDKRWTLAGVISWGIGCAEPNQPGVYTRISAFKDWINQILQF